MTRRRLTIQEAAEEIGTTVDALRSRIRRGNIDSEKGDDGRVYVWLDNDQAETSQRPGGDESKASVEGSIEEELRDRIRFVEGQLEAEREAHKEARRIIGGLVQRIPQLEAPRGEQNPGDFDQGPGSEGHGTPDSAEGDIQGKRWWKFWR